VDLTTITTFLSQYGTWGILLAGVLTLTSDYWLPAVKGLFNRRSETIDDDTDTLDLLALKRLQARAERSGCKEFKGSVRCTEVCFFNHAEAVEGAK
jgi:hypothetical protein